MVGSCDFHENVRTQALDCEPLPARFLQTEGEGWTTFSMSASDLAEVCQSGPSGLSDTLAFRCTEGVKEFSCSHGCNI